MLRLVYAAALVLMATMTPAAGSVTSTNEKCTPHIHLLPPLEGDSDSRLTAMNARGWAVGTSIYYDPDTLKYVRSSSALWRGTGPIVDLELSGVHDLYSEPMDINKHGIVAVQRTDAKRAGRTIPAASWLWLDGERTKLRGSRERPHVYVEALNDHGVAVGSTQDASHRLARPMLWREGEREVLPLPPGATGWAVDINNRGLVVGNVQVRGSDRYESEPWYWRPSGKSGPLPRPAGEDLNVTDVDNHGRVLASNGYEMGPKAYLWSSPTAWPRYLGRARATAVAMSDHGDLTGSAGGFRGISAGAWVGHTADREVERLPAPPGPESWQNTFGVAVIREVTSLAPEGGVSVGGTANPWPDDGFNRATIWTCAQTY